MPEFHGFKDFLEARRPETLRTAADEGRVMALGWETFHSFTRLANLPEDEVRRLRSAYFSGAEWVMNALREGLTPEGEPDEVSFQRLERVYDEIKRWFLDRGLAALKDLAANLDEQPPAGHA